MCDFDKSERRRGAVGLAAVMFGAAVILFCFGEAAAQPSLTVYNDNFAVVREFVELDLEEGVNKVAFTDATALLEPSSVMLRDPRDEWGLRVLEQNYWADPVSEGLLLSLYEGKTIDFLIPDARVAAGGERRVPGLIVRSGYQPPQSTYRMRGGIPSTGAVQPIIEMEGTLRFGLPGRPLFPALADDTILKPTLHWQIASDRAGILNAELCYVTTGMSWEADYNLVSPEDSDEIDFVGWVTIANNTGKAFRDARIKLMAGDVSRIQPAAPRMEMMNKAMAMADHAVTEKAFDEFYLYTLHRPTTMRDRETKQVEFARATGVESQRIYIYQGQVPQWLAYRMQPQDLMRQRDWGTVNSKVWVMREFENTRENGLGIPLPRGRMRFYRRDTDGQLEFTGEAMIDHTPRNEKISVQTGSAFDLVGGRRQTAYNMEQGRNTLRESFEISLRNRKEKDAVEIRVVERLRQDSWTITNSSHQFTKIDGQTIQFLVPVEADTEQKVTYDITYTW